MKMVTAVEDENITVLLLSDEQDMILDLEGTLTHMRTWKNILAKVWAWCGERLAAKWVLATLRHNNLHVKMATAEHYRIAVPW